MTSTIASGNGEMIVLGHDAGSGQPRAAAPAQSGQPEVAASTRPARGVLQPSVFYENLKSLKRGWPAVASWCRTNTFMLLVLAGALAGVVIGSVLRSLDVQDGTTLTLVAFPGELFLRTFKLLLLPLVISSITTASSTLNAKTNGKMAGVTIAYFLLSSLASSVIGLVVVTAIHPGNPETRVQTAAQAHNAGSHLLDTILDLIRNIVPENIIGACLQQVQTVYTQQELTNAVTTIDNGTITVLNETVVQLKRQLIYRNQANYLGLIVFFFVFGTVLGAIGQAAKPLANMFAILDRAVLLIITKFSWFTPLGVASLICERVVVLPRLDHLAAQLGVYMVTVFTTLGVHIFVFIPLVYFVAVRKNPFKMIAAVTQALMTAFVTDSSAIALPLTLQCMEEKLKTDRRVTRFVLPLGVTVNMDGTAAFLVLAAIFLAQMNGVAPTAGEIMSVLLSATLASVAAVAAPSASLFLLGIVTSVIGGVSTDDIAILFAVDWLLSRCRAISNVLGDCCGAAVVERICRKDLRAIDEDEKGALPSNRKCNGNAEEQQKLALSEAELECLTMTA